MRYLSISIIGPDNNTVSVVGPGGVPTGGLNITNSAIQLGITLLFTLAIILFIIFVILSGIQWASSGGNKENIQKARRRLIFAIVGLIIVLLSFFIYATIANFIYGTTSGSGGRPNRPS